MIDAKFMMRLWTGCIVLGLTYLIFLWDHSFSPAFIVSQIVLGIIGVLREFQISKNINVNTTHN